MSTTCSTYYKTNTLQLFVYVTTHPQQKRQILQSECVMLEYYGSCMKVWKYCQKNNE
jgi:hypothetical protein